MDKFALDLARGADIGISGLQGLNKFGRAADCDADDPTDIWDRADAISGQKIWVPPDGSIEHEIASTSASDTELGTGARKVLVEGIDQNLVFASEEVALNGTTAVETNTTFLRVFRLKVVSFGSAATNIGTITATAIEGGPVSAQISIGYAQTLMAIYTTPSNLSLAIGGYYGSIDKGSGSTTAVHFELLICSNIQNADIGWRVIHTMGLMHEGTSTVKHTFEVPVIVDPLTDVKLRVISSAANTSFDGGFHGCLYTP